MLLVIGLQVTLDVRAQPDHLGPAIGYLAVLASIVAVGTWTGTRYASTWWKRR